jgi:hypothetical protein
MRDEGLSVRWAPESSKQSDNQSDNEMRGDSWGSGH